MKLMDYGLKPLDFQNPTITPERTDSGFSRRGFVMTSLASGFAVASNPVLAQAITTDSTGLVAGEVSVPVADGKIPAYRAMPAKPGKYPVLLVVQEIFGVHEHIKDMCRRFARLGYYAIAPEMYARQGDVSKMTDIGTILSTVVAKVPDAQVNADLDAAVAFAAASGNADTARLGLVGYCWGGRAAWVYALHNPKLKAVVSYYGLLDGMKSPIKPQDPVDFAATLKVCWGCMPASTASSSPLSSTRCAPAWSSRAAAPRSSSSRMSTTGSTPTTGRPTTKLRPPTRRN